jgi:ribosomal protein S18 acetylase RimI-like enzyme
MPIFVPRRYAVVDGLAVTAAFQHQGVGRLLMDAAHSWAAARGAGAIELNVYAFNETAIAFYRSLGYEIYSVRMSRALAAPTTGRQPDAEKAHKMKGAEAVAPSLCSGQASRRRRKRR